MIDLRLVVALGMPGWAGDGDPLETLAMKRDPRTDQEIINAVLAAACDFIDCDSYDGDDIEPVVAGLEMAVAAYRRRIRERDGELMGASVP